MSSRRKTRLAIYQIRKLISVIMLAGALVFSAIPVCQCACQCKSDQCSAEDDCDCRPQVNAAACCCCSPWASLESVSIESDDCCGFGLCCSVSHCPCCEEFDLPPADAPGIDTQSKVDLTLARLIPVYELKPPPTFELLVSDKPVSSMRVHALLSVWQN